MRTYRNHRKLLMENGISDQTPRGAFRILALLVESGMIYILIGVSFTLVFKYGLSRILFSLQLTTVVSVVISLRLGHNVTSTIIAIVGIQLAVRNAFKESPSNRIDFVIWRLGNLPNPRNSTRGEEALAQCHISVWHNIDVVPVGSTRASGTHELRL
jgi:hypothetical protein